MAIDKIELLKKTPREVREILKTMTSDDAKQLNLKASEVKFVWLEAVKNEIQNDPAGLGYAGKSNAAIATLLTQPYTVFEQRSELVESAPLVQIIKTVSQGGKFSGNVTLGADGRPVSDNKAFHDALNAAVDEELKKPEYASLDTQQIADKLRNGKFALQNVPVEKPSRLYQITIGIPHCPNKVATADIVQALQ